MLEISFHALHLRAGGGLAAGTAVAMLAIGWLQTAALQPSVCFVSKRVSEETADGGDNCAAILLVNYCSSSAKRLPSCLGYIRSAGHLLLLETPSVLAPLLALPRNCGIVVIPGRCVVRLALHAFAIHNSDR
ncbi:hypothetical protein PHYPSEUDO_004701 [Phytophthora pseudosyringae]|uniref:Uncharacterized protein n=1 Tax=Phytophthora pseudosyringae TaxID=221518 RepID=A0A8T1VN86_9STRA|nr:hypothetical protein PHYPSEUDO_004701 [Phytophthora pseudosyringae]